MGEFIESVREDLRSEAGVSRWNEPTAGERIHMALLMAWWSLVLIAALAVAVFFLLLSAWLLVKVSWWLLFTVLAVIIAAGWFGLTA